MKNTLVFLIKARSKSPAVRRSASSKIRVVEKGNGKRIILSLFVGKMQSGMEPRGGSACQGWGLVLHLVGTSVLHVFQQFLPCCVHPQHVHHLHYNSQSFHFTASCFFRSFGGIYSWELLEMCVMKFDLFISFYLFN